MAKSRYRVTQLLLSAILVFAGACDRHTASPGQSVSIDPADSILIPERHPRFYRGPDADNPNVTIGVSIQVGGRERFILAQTKIQDGPLAIVSDSSGLVPVFDSEREARDYIARVFSPRLASTDSTAAAAASAYAEMLAQGETMHVDLDRALQWSKEPSSRSAGPVQLALVWEVLAAADAALPMAQFDPMSMPALYDQIRRGDADSTAARIAMTGMILSGITSEALRRGTNDDAPWPAGLDSVWTANENTLLARIIRTGIANLTSRLSAEAAKRDVTETWPERAS